MSDHEAISACSSPATFVETNCPTDVSLDISVKIERIQSDNEEISDTETFIIPYEEPDVMTWLSDDSSLCRRKLQVKLMRLPTFLLKLFIKEPDRNNGLNSEPTSLLIAEGCNSDSEQLSDPELASIVFKSKFKSAMSRLLSSAFQQKPVNKEGSPSNNDFNCKANGTSETNHIAPDTDSPMALRNENNNFPTKISKISTDYYTLETSPAKEYKCSMLSYRRRPKHKKRQNGDEIPT
ncbi:hypothetical protein O0L34_g419 [Tuta absoluta]|nr:hypothetical protein O0L34_g419 [Tuta absoluta]